ncbi:amino acid/amide ABC transporter substrate-binding protein (HAAT family) [Enterovirga rhinocerotis]|uniref:Amino acid/amide ABC transporter substrate-binding protein (HAAT family) n=1 Tax=Enterovirga rhinocerotis TaxID=1339210 RepID=A0A4R7C8K5_9HYPH|nr:ABC transporter substrate-binding protein [Enterovirga rhinocerotis]TDR94583.1 amino acid/amide ABC transporter substrate-binding protein (HAAT family) [Enterovirga rhinocerotis]
MTSFRRWAALLAASAALLATPAQALDRPVKIGILNDQSGLYADLAGPGSVEAARLAIEDFGGSVLGRPVELVSADHQNKADIGAGIARLWFDKEGVDVIADFSNSAVGLAVQAIAKDKQKVTIVAAASSAFTGKACSPNSVQWVYTSRTNGYGLAKVLSARGADSWFLITVDYAFGHAFADEIRKAVTEARGKVAGEVRHPLATQDMSSYLLAAQASKAKVIALASAGSDMTTTVKQASEFGVAGGATIVTPIVFLTDVHAMGLKAAQGLQFLTAFYWDRDEASRAFAKRFYDRHKAMPTMTQAGIYSSVLHYLKAVKAAGTNDASAVMAKMREIPVSDAFAPKGFVREDGQMIHDMYLVEVKKPEESKGPWDYYKVLATVPGEEVFQRLSESECPLVKK